MTLVKSAPKKSFSQKTTGIFPVENLLSPKKIGFLGKTFFGCNFYLGQMYVFEISMERRIF
jgi:hypothetical protein